MSNFAFCGNCRGLSRDEDERERSRRQAYGHADGVSPFWRPWCPEDVQAEPKGPRAVVGNLSHLEADGFVQTEKDELRRRSSLDIDNIHQLSRCKLEDSAATRIQASFRGRRTRINHQTSVVTFRASTASEGSDTPRKSSDGGGASASTKRVRSVSFAGVSGKATEDHPSSPSNGAQMRPQASMRTCCNGHPLKGPARSPHAVQRRCAGCKRNFIGEAMMWHCKRCSYFVCQACGSSGACCGNALKPGSRVQLCGMNNQLLNCMNGYIQARADQNRYTVLISELGDTITLPARNLEQQADESSGSEESCSESSGSEVFDSNNPTTRKRKKRKTIAQRAMRSIRKKSTNFVSQVARVAKSIVGEGLAGGAAELVSQAGATADGQVPLLEAWWAEKKRLAKEQLLEVSAPMRKRMLENIGEFVKDSAMRDPDMWNWVRPVVKSAVAGIWDDIETEIESNIEVALTDQRSEVDLHSASCLSLGPTFRTPLLNRWGAIYLRVRAFLLNHYLPYNKTFFGKLKDPVFDFLVALTMLPLFGVRFFFFSVLLFMLIVPGPADEYQLVNYILHFKGTMFFTSGVIMLFMGAMQYNWCYLFSAEELRRCIETSGPGANEWLCTLILDYLGSISLVWVAWLVLPCSRKFPSHVETMRGWSRREEERSVYCCCLEGVVTRGGRLGGLLSYDVFCFLLSFGTMASFYLATNDGRHWDPSPEGREAWWTRAKAVTYWCQVLYALFSLPFALFVVPVFSWLLTHSTFTGYNQFGACVEFAFPVRKKEPAEKSP